MGDKLSEIKSNEELNLFAAKTEEKLSEIEVTYASKFKELEDQKVVDEETQKKWYEETLEKFNKENVELKTALDVTQTQLAEVKEEQKTRYTKVSGDEKMKQIGDFLFAMKRKDFKTIFEMGGKVNTATDKLEWKVEDWDMKAAPNLGTPLRGDAATGSILVPEIWANEILRIPTDPSALMGKVRSVPMSARKINYPAKLAGVAFAWPSDETQLKLEKNPTFSDIELEAKTAAGWIAYTEELNEDTVVPLAEYFTSLFREAWAVEFDNQCLVSNTAPFVGVLRNAAANIVTMATATFASTTLDDLANLVASLDDQSKRNGAAFMMHVTVQDVLRTLRNDNGDYIYAPPANNLPGTIWGYPVLLSDAMPDLASSAVSTPFVAFGNPKWILHGDRVGFEIRIFSETADAMVYDRLFLRCRLRQAFKTAFPTAFGVLRTSA